MATPLVGDQFPSNYLLTVSMTLPKFVLGSTKYQEGWSEQESALSSTFTHVSKNILQMRANVNVSY